MDLNDRRNSASILTNYTTLGDAEHQRWENMDAHTPGSPLRREVHEYYGNQKSSPAWDEANQIARKRTTAQAREEGFSRGIDYAYAYEDHLGQVLNEHGKSLAEKHGLHKQSGYGRV